jgi:hypothetical protein
MVIAFLVGLVLGAGGGGYAAYRYYANIVADLNAGVAAYKRALTTAQQTAAAVKTDVEKAL